MSQVGSRLLGRVAIVTGGGRGIGREIALDLAREGTDVAVADLDRASAESTAQEICKLGQRAISIQVDVRSKTQMDALVTQTVKELEHLDIMVNNAGIGHCKPLLDITEEEWDRVFSINIKGMLFGIQAAAQVMIGAQRGGRIINIASVAGKSGRPLLAAYAASKAAAINLTQSAAGALASHRITVNAICPGVVGTVLAKDVLGQMKEYLDSGQATEDMIRVPPALLGPEAQPRDISRMVVYLASDDGAYITAQSINIDGGRCTH